MEAAQAAQQRADRRARPTRRRSGRTRSTSGSRPGSGSSYVLPGRDAAARAAPTRRAPPATPGSRPTAEPAGPDRWYDTLWSSVAGRQRGPTRGEVACATAGPRSPPTRRPTWPRSAAQLGRTPRGTRAVAHRCPCGLPDVVETTPRLADGTPFPTLFYLTCPRATAACSRLESAGVMREMPDAAGRRPGAGRALPGRRTRTTWPGARRSAHVAGDRRRLGRRHAGPGEVPARAPRPRAGRRPWGQPVRRRGARTLIEPWWTGGPCVEPD